jgi:hypothetical protein
MDGVQQLFEFWKRHYLAVNISIAAALGEMPAKRWVRVPIVWLLYTRWKTVSAGSSGQYKNTA